MDKTSKVLLVLVFLALTANFFKPVFYPKRAFADQPYQVAVLKSEFNYKLNKLIEQVQTSDQRLEKMIKKLEQKFDKHTHKLDTCGCEEGAGIVNVETSKP
jgi:Skp family chaperone for outer membrane proteins